MNILYRIYQFLIVLPLALVATGLCAIITILGCFIGVGNFWGYYPGKIWAWTVCRLLLLPIHVEGRENLVPGQSYVFVANHQGPMDIFLIYGFLGRNVRKGWPYLCG